MSKSRLSSFHPELEQLERIDLPSTTPLIGSVAAPSPFDQADWGNEATPQGIAEVVTMAPGTYFDGPALSPDGSRLLIGSRDGTLRIFESATGRQLSELPSVHEGLVRGVAWSPDGTTIASGGQRDRTVKFWDAATGALKRTVAVSDLGTGMQFGDDGKLYILCSNDGVFRIDPLTGTSDCVAPKEDQYPDRFTILADGTVAMTLETEVRQYDASGNTMRKFRTDSAPSRIAAGRNFLAISEANSTISIWNPDSGQKMGSLSAGFQNLIRSLSATDYGLAAGDGMGNVAVWDMTESASGLLPASPLQRVTATPFVSGIALNGKNIIIASCPGPSDPPTLSLLRLAQAPGPQPVVVPSPSPAETPVTDIETTDDAAAAIAAAHALTEETLVTAETIAAVFAEQAAVTAETIETAESMGEARMHLSIEHTSGGAWITARLRSPEDASYLEILNRFNGGVLDHAQTDHPGGTHDSTLRVQIRNGLGFSGLLPVRMRAGEGGKILQTMYVSWNDDSHQMRLLTPQDSFEQQSIDSMYPREAIEPAMQIETSGRLIFIRFQSPRDRSVLDITRSGDLDTLGRASTQEICHPGGTRETAVQLAIPADAPTDTTLKLRLWDKAYGNILSDVILEYDGTNVTVGSGQSTVGSGPIARETLLQSVMDMQEDIRGIQGTALYERSRFFVSGSELETRLRAAFPNDFPENLGAVAEQMHREGPTYSIGFYENQLIDRQQSIRDEYRDVMNGYASTMANLLLPAVDFWIRIRGGEAERPLEDALHAAFDAARFGNIDALGLTRPTFGMLLAEGKALCAKYNGALSQAQQDNAALLRALASQPLPAESGVPAPRTISAEAHAHTLNIILTSEGIDSPAIRAARYVLSHPDANLIAQSLMPTPHMRDEYIAEKKRLTAILYANAGMSDSGFVWASAQQSPQISINRSLDMPTSKNTAIIVIYGSNQFPGDTNAGFEKLVTNLRVSYENVWPFSPGFNPSAGIAQFVPGPSPAEMQPEIQRFISSYIPNNDQIKNIVLVGYSWGGGMVFDISQWLANSFPNIHLAASVYVDAINDDYSMGAENRMPIGTQSMLNIFQSQTNIKDWYLNGDLINENNGIQDLVQIDMDFGGNFLTHDTIDNKTILFIFDFIRQRILAIQ